MLYSTLLRNQWKQTTRTYASRYRWLAILVLVVIGIYVAVLLVTSGFFFWELTRAVGVVEDPVALLNAYGLSAFLALFMARFFFQRPPQVRIQPYLHLPIPRSRLVRYFQFASLASIHNLYPLLFFLPFWYRYVLYGVYSPAGALTWLSGVFLLLAAAHFANNLLRTIVSGSLRGALLVAGLLGAVLLLDHFLGTLVLHRASAGLFSALLAGNAGLLVLLALLTVLITTYSTWLLKQRLLWKGGDAGARDTDWRTPFRPAWGQVLNLILLELTLIRRNRRPKTYLLLSLFFGTVYTALFLFDPGAESSSLMAAFIGVFASGMFAMNYGQLMFAWESSYFDGFLVRDVHPRSMVLAKLILLQGSCGVFFFLTLPLFYGLAPGMIVLHFTFLLYNAGVTCMLMMALAVANQKRVDLQKGGGFFNYEGFSVVHWLWFVPTILPPTLVLFLFQDDRRTALLLIGGLGLLSAGLTRLWSAFFARLLMRRKHTMAAGFRTHD